MGNIQLHVGEANKSVGSTGNLDVGKEFFGHHRISAEVAYRVGRQNILSNFRLI